MHRVHAENGSWLKVAPRILSTVMLLTSGKTTPIYRYNTCSIATNKLSEMICTTTYRTSADAAAYGSHDLAVNTSKYAVYSSGVIAS